MARLMECGFCGHSVSKSAESCPQCGAQLKLRWYEGNWSTIFKAVIVIVLFFLVISLLSGI
jgi:uncharacterized OB-fold protein